MSVLLVLGAIILVSGSAFALSNSGAAPMKNWTKWDELFKKYGKLYDVSWKWLKAISLNESSLGNEPSVAHGLRYPSDIEKSKSYDGKSWGLMQITMPTALGLDPNATEEKLNNPEYSIKLAAQLLDQLKASFSTLDFRYEEWVIKSYNQGPGNTRKEQTGWRGPWSDHVQEYWERFKRNLRKVEENL